MDRLTPFTPLMQVASSFLNALQDWINGSNAASGSGTTNDFSSDMMGRNEVFFQPNTGVPTDDFVVLDDTRSWKDALLHGRVTLLSGSTQQIGQADDDELNDPAGTALTVEIPNYYSGTGAYSTTAAATGVSPGSPPVNGVGAVRSYAYSLYTDSTGAAVTLFVRASDGALCVYNETASTLYLYGAVSATAPTGLRP